MSTNDQSKPPPVVQMANVSVAYGRGPQILREVSLRVDEGEFVAILGASGSGKTTILRLIAGLLEPSSGSVEVLQQEVSRREPRDRGVGLVFQTLALFPHMSVDQNVRFGLRYRALPRSTKAKMVSSLLGLLQLEEHASKLPGELSGGQAQRVALARVLATEPRVLLLDEPFAHLDRPLADLAAALVMRIHREKGLTSVLVTHDREQALALATRVAVLGPGGQLVQVDDPRVVYERPATADVARLTGPANLIPAVEISSDSRSTTVSVDSAHITVDSRAHLDGTERVLFFRPEWASVHLEVDGPLSPNEIQATATHTAIAASQRFLHGELHGFPVIVPLENGAATAEPGTAFRIRLDRTRAVLFPENLTKGE